MSRIAYPFLTLGNDALEATVWELVGQDSKSVPLQRYIQDWDYLRPIRIRRTVRLNREVASLHLGIPEADLDLRVFFRFGTGPGTMPRAWIRSGLVQPDEAEGIYCINEELDGGELSGRLKLETTVLSFGQSFGASSLSPAIKGAKVWSHEFDVLLEGSEPRFPMETISFEKAFPDRTHASSLWYLHWSPGSLHRDFGGAVRLYLNADREDFITRLTENDPILMQTIMADVMTQLITNVVSMDESEAAIAQAEEGSVASYVGSWIQIAFPGEKPTDVRSKLENRPGDFYAAVLAAAEIGGF